MWNLKHKSRLHSEAVSPNEFNNYFANFPKNLINSLAPPNNNSFHDFFVTTLYFFL